MGHLIYCVVAYMMFAGMVYEVISRDEDWVLSLVVAMLWPILLFTLVYDRIVYGKDGNS